MPRRWTALALAAALLTGCSAVQQTADEEAARVADHVLPSALGDAIASSGAQTPEERAVAGRDWLSDPDPSVTDSQGGVTWVVRGRTGTTVRVDVYRYWESGDFFPPDQGKAVWGLTCRSYDVAEGVTTRRVQCPPGTPEAP